MSGAADKSKRDPNEERITKLEQAQDALMKKIEGIDAYFKDPEGLTKQIEKTVSDSMLGGLKAYDKTVQERFAMRGETRALASGTTTENKEKNAGDGFDFRGIIEDVRKGLTGSGSTGVKDPNYQEYLHVRDDLMTKALSGLGRGLGRGVEKEVTHLVKFD